MLSAIVAWWAYRQGKQSARRQAMRHMAAVAHALYTGSTAAYDLTPDLPRQADSTNVCFTSED
jgi:hypothetical protein